MYLMKYPYSSVTTFFAFLETSEFRPKMVSSYLNKLLLWKYLAFVNILSKEAKLREWYCAKAGMTAPKIHIIYLL